MIIEQATAYFEQKAHVFCPNCSKKIDLYDFPYDDESTGFSDPGEYLRKAARELISEPDSRCFLHIQVKCCHCNNDFVINNLEI